MLCLRSAAPFSCCANVTFVRCHPIAVAEAEWGFRTRISRAEFLPDGSDIWASLCSFGRSQRYSWRYSHNPQFIKSSLEELIELSIATRPCSPETETFTA
jgi:hypothetical protein